MRLPVLLTALFTAACSSPGPPQRPPPPTEPPPSPKPPVKEKQASPKPEPAAVEVPTRCAAKDGGLCTPPAEFVEALCKKRQPNVALTMFHKGSPWTRTYVRVRNMEAWLVGGQRTSPAKMKLYEEVIIVDDRSAGEGGVKVSGTGSFDVVRWDGSCVSLMSDEVSTRRPGVPEVATIRWKRLDSGVRRALMKDKRIAYRDEQRKEHCSGAKDGHRCETARARLSQMVATYIREGGNVPSPTTLE